MSFTLSKYFWRYNLRLNVTVAADKKTNPKKDMAAEKKKQTQKVVSFLTSSNPNRVILYFIHIFEHNHNAL